MEVRAELPPPPKMRTNLGRRDPDKYCLYHRDHDHNIEDYNQLKEEIERLIRKERLDWFIRRQDPPH